METLDNTLAALAIGQRFAPVFPTVDGRPRCAHGVHDASRDPARIKALWSGCPGANVSIATGRAAGVVGLDIDMKGGRDGMASLAALEAEHGPLPRTPYYSTPSGGLGYLFKAPSAECRTRFDFRPGLELHGDGAAMTLPPSRKNGVPYLWKVTPLAAPLADIPAWLLAVANPQAPELNRPIGQPGQVARTLRTSEPARLALYIARAVELECDAVAKMGKDSGRNRALFIAAAKLGELVGADLLPQAVAESELEEAAKLCGLANEDGWRSVRATIASGLTRGIRQPRRVTI